MKKIVVLAALAITTLSCKKRYTCECLVEQNVGGFTQKVPSTWQTEKMSRADAEKECSAGEINQNWGGVSQSVECELKD